MSEPSHDGGDDPQPVREGPERIREIVRSEFAAAAAYMAEVEGEFGPEYDLRFYDHDFDLEELLPAFRDLADELSGPTGVQGLEQVELEALLSVRKAGTAEELAEMEEARKTSREKLWAALKEMRAE